MRTTSDETGQIGKCVRGRLYIHVSAFDALPKGHVRMAEQAEQALKKARGVDFNVVKIDPEKLRVSLLHYADFLDDPFPALTHCWGIDLQTSQRWERTFIDRENPPILHRKELLLAPETPGYDEYAALTEALVARGLLRAHGIGVKLQWDAHLAQNGYKVVGSHLVQTTDPPASVTHDNIIIERNRTALARSELSAPMQALARLGYLDGDNTVFDYGCGRGDDVRILGGRGLEIYGWDPHFFPHEPKLNADIVNLGFVLNVIEDPQERSTVLEDAYQLADRLLVVSVMVARGRARDGELHADGIRTKRQTFQKYYTQAELAWYIENVLGEEPSAIAPGVFLVFKEKAEEQAFLARRQDNRIGLGRLMTSSRRKSRAVRDQEIYEEHRNLLDAAFDQWLELGRKPVHDEVPNPHKLEEIFGSINKAFRFLERLRGPEVIHEAVERRKADLLVYLALREFQGRSGYKNLPVILQRDIKAFFGNRDTARAAGTALLFASGDSEEILKACRSAGDQGLGYLNRDKSLELHTSLVHELPPVLRVYVGCGLKVYGDFDTQDMLKIHIGSGKLTLTRFDDFEGKALPRLLERAKVRLKDSDVDFFEYGSEYTPPYLYLKSRYINSRFRNYDNQIAFDHQLKSLGAFDFSAYGPKPEEFDDTLSQLKLQVEGFELVPTGQCPDLDDRCGKYFRYRDLVECGETQAKAGLNNVPVQPETYLALRRLAGEVLDPVMDYFGGIRLTYGFCSVDLAKRITANIAPKIDQHAAYERNSRGQRICRRGGAAVDFIVDNEDMLEVANWIVEHTLFDRLYFYGAQQPLHVSVGPENNREIVLMLGRETKTKGIRRIPRVVSADVLAEMAQLG